MNTPLFIIVKYVSFCFVAIVDFVYKLYIYWIENKFKQFYGHANVWSDDYLLKLS